MTRLVIWLCVGMCAAIGLVTRFQHPELTETQLMLVFWDRWLLAIALACVAVLGARRMDRP